MRHAFRFLLFCCTGAFNVVLPFFLDIMLFLFDFHAFRKHNNVKISCEILRKKRRNVFISRLFLPTWHFAHIMYNAKEVKKTRNTYDSYVVIVHSSGRYCDRSRASWSKFEVGMDHRCDRTLSARLYEFDDWKRLMRKWIIPRRNSRLTTEYIIGFADEFSKTNSDMMYNRFW